MKKIRTITMLMLFALLINGHSLLYGQGSSFQSVEFIERNFDEENLNNPDFVSFLDEIKFRTKANYIENTFLNNEIIYDTIFHLFESGTTKLPFQNSTPQPNWCNYIIIPSNDSGSVCWNDDSTAKIAIPLEYGMNTITFTTYLSNEDFKVSPDTLFVFHPMPQVIAGSYNEISPDTISPGTPEPIMFFNPEVKFQAELIVNDTFSYQENIKMQVYLDDSTLTDNNFTIPSDSTSQYLIPGNIDDNIISLSDYDAHHIWYKAYFEVEGVGDSLVFESDSLHVQRIKPEFETFDIIEDEGTPNINIAQVDTIFQDIIRFKIELEYNDNINSGDSIEVHMTMYDAENPFYNETKHGITQPGDTIITIPGDDFFEIPLDDHYNVDLELCFVTKFFREDVALDTLDICNAPIIIYHPAPAIDSVKYTNWNTAEFDTTGTGVTSEFFNKTVRFQTLNYYNDPFSYEEQINLQVIFDGDTLQEIYNNTTEIVNFPQCRIPYPDSIEIQLTDYEEHTISFCSNFANDFQDPAECSNTIHVKRIKPVIDNFVYMNTYPPNLLASNWETVYTDSVMFRTKLWYNDSINTGDNIQVIALREVYSEGQVEKVDTAYNVTIPQEPDPDSLYIEVPPEDQDRLIVPLNENYDSILVFFQANFIRDGLVADTMFSYNTDSIKIIHPAPAVEELLYDTSILQPSNVDIEPDTPVTVFDNTVQVRMQINYEDTCSVGDTIYLQPYYNGNPIGDEPLYDSTRFWGEGNIKIPRTGYPLYDIPIDYGEFENDWDTIHFEAYFGKTPDSKASSENLFIYREKPIITSFDYIQKDPTYLSTTSWDSIYQDKVKFQVQLNYNDNLIQGDSIKTVIYREVNGGEPVVIEETTLSKPNDGNTLTFPNADEKYIVETDPFFDDSIRIYFESWFIREDLPNPDTCNPGGGEALLIYHPKPKVDTVIFSVTDPDDLVIGDSSANKFIYDDIIKFRANVHYKDTFSLDEQIWVQAKRIYENNPPEEIGKKFRFTLDNANNIEIPTPDSLFADTIGYNFGSYKYYMDAWFYLHDTITLDIVPSDTLYLFHPKPLVDTVMFELIEPDDLVIGEPGANLEVYEDNITFRADVNYNDPLSQNETIKARVMKIYNGDTIQQGQILQGTTLEGNDITIPASPELFDVFLGYEFGDHEIYIEAWFDLDGVEVKDTITSQSIYLTHPKPTVQSVNFELIDPDDLEIGQPGANPEVYEDSITFRANVGYNDYLSEDETIVVQALKKYDNGDFELIQQKSRETLGDNNTDLTIPGEPGLFDIQLDYEFGEHEIILVSWFELDGVTELDRDTSDVLYLNHPKPLVDSIRFINFNPGELSSYLNTIIDIYNPEIEFGVKVFYNDYLSDDEKIKLNLYHTYFEGNEQVTEIIKDSLLTIEQGSGIVPSIILPIDTFPINQYDSAYHKFKYEAWFDLENISEIDSVPSDDSLTINYRINKKPVVEITTPYDEIYTHSDSITISGIVTDNTGWINDRQLFVQINDQEFDTATVGDQNQNFQQSFEAVVFLDEPINNVFAWARDTVPFTDEEELISARDSIRLVYLHFAPDLGHTYCPQDSNYLLHALPVGGQYSGVGIVNSSGVFNPDIAGSGIHPISYHLSTTSDDATIIENFEVVEETFITGKQLVNNNQKEIYTIDNSANNLVKSWVIKGGVVSQIKEDSIEVRWDDYGTNGSVEAIIENTEGCYYNRKKLIGIAYETAPGKAQIILENGNLFICNISEADSFQWYRNNEPIFDDENTANNNKSYYFRENAALDDDAYYFVRIFDKKYRLHSDSYLLFPPNTICEGCEYDNPIFFENENIPNSINSTSGILNLEFPDNTATKIIVKILKSQSFELIRQVIMYPSNYTPAFNCQISDILQGDYLLIVDIIGGSSPNTHEIEVNITNN